MQSWRCLDWVVFSTSAGHGISKAVSRCNRKIQVIPVDCHLSPTIYIMYIVACHSFTNHIVHDHCFTVQKCCAVRIRRMWYIHNCFVKFSLGAFVRQVRRQKRWLLPLIDSCDLMIVPDLPHTTPDYMPSRVIPDHQSIHSISDANDSESITFGDMFSTDVLSRPLIPKDKNVLSLDSID